MKHPPQAPDRIPGRAVTGALLGAVAASIAGVLIALALGECRAAELGADWLPPPRPQLPGEINAMETRMFTVEAQGLEGHARAERRLATYGWIDPRAGIVRVPIDVAIALVIARWRAAGGRP